METNLNLWLIPALPLAGAALNGLLGRRFPKALVSAVALLGSGSAFAWVLFVASRFAGLPEEAIPHIEKYGTWFAVGNFSVPFAFQLDQLTMIMLLVVTGVGFLIHIYSVGYMAHEGGYYRFFSYLNLFMFFMLMLVLSNNYMLMFVGWEGVGLASYLLIGFFFLKDSAASAGKKAFIVNRIGDFAFLIALFLLIKHFGTLTFSDLFAKISTFPVEQNWGLLTTIGVLLMGGACGKSAQIPLYVWLPDAMEGPTPVSALIHAATMVTAGVYMVTRSNPIFFRSPDALLVVAVIGTLTALFAATIGLAQNDIKRVLAYSTDLAARLHVHGLRRGRLRRRHLPPDDPRLLQGAALPRRRLGDPLPEWRAGHAQHGRPAQAHPVHLLDHDDGHLRHRGVLPVRRILLEG